MIDHKVNRHQRLNDLRVAAKSFHRVAHRCKVDNQRHAGEILKYDARDDEGNFRVRRRFRVPVRQCLDIFAPDFFPIAISQYRFEHDANTHWQSGNFLNALFFQRRQRIQKSFAAVTGVEFRQRIKFVLHSTRVIPSGVEEFLIVFRKAYYSPK